MTKVGNRKVIRRFAFRELQSNPKMNLVVILSIVLTCILFTALTSIGGSLMNGMRQETMRQVGGDSMAGLKYVLPEDYEKVRSDNATKNVVYRILVGRAVNDAFRNISVEVNCAGNEAAAKAMFCSPTEGRLPEGYDEIAVSTLVLDELKLPHELGVTVPITLDVDGKISTHEFILCGYWQGEKVAMAQECWVSKAFADEYAPTPSESFYAQAVPKYYAGYYMVDFNFQNSWDIEDKTSALLKRLYGESDLAPDTGVNWAYLTSTVDSGTLAGGLAMLLVIFAAGYLIIYNIFHINISANIRSYGLLKTIGTTSRQIRRIVRIQAAVYCAAGIPLGLIIGVLLGKVMMGSIMTSMNIYSMASYTVSAKLLALMCLVSAAFTFATVMISCRKPGRIAGSVSPIEALRYNETTISARKSKKTAKVTPLSAAQNNMSRSRKKTAVVVLSLTLSLVIVNTLFTVLHGIDMDKFLRTLIVGDFVVTCDQGSYFDDDVFRKITPEHIDYLEQIDGVSEICPVYFEYGTLKLSGKPLERLNAFYDKYANSDKHGSLKDAAESKKIDTDIYGAAESILQVLDPQQGKLEAEKWSSGKYALVFTGYVGAEPEQGENIFYSPGDAVTVSANGKSRQYEVMAVCDIPYALSTQRYSEVYGHILIPDSEYFALAENRSAMSVMINSEENRFDDVDTQIRSLTDSEDSQLTLKSKQTYLGEFNQLIRMIKLVGGTLSGILALIGILNFINAVVTGILSRKRELAMMNAVGMTGRQLKAMLRWEGAHYAALTALCSMAAGSLLSCLVVNSITEELFFFTYRFTLLPLFVCVPILLALSALIPSAAYRQICRESIVDRLRENG